MNPIIKCVGGKHYLRKWIKDNVKVNYNELISCCGGGLSFEINYPGKHNVIFDTNTDLINLYKCISDPKHFKTLKYILQLYCSNIKLLDRALFDKLVLTYKTSTLFHPENAAEFLIVNRLSRDGLNKNFANGNRLRGGNQENINALLGAVSSLDSFHQLFNNRIFGFYCSDCITNLTNFVNSNYVSDNLIYIDPPYLHSTRGSKKLYNEEWDQSKHEDLLRIVSPHINNKNQILISGYDNTLYDYYLAGWRKAYKTVNLNISALRQKKNIRTEVIWTNK